MTKRILVAFCVFFLCAWAYSRTSVSGPEKWSNPATWHGAVPSAGMDIVIPAGKSILLDVSPPPLRSLRIEGTLTFADRDLTLQASNISVPGGLNIGSENRPFVNRAIVLLSNCLGVTGTVEMHGEPRGSGWTWLAQIAPAGSQSIVLQITKPWRTGDRIVIASTTFDTLETEERRITGVQGTKINLDAPLHYTHWGQVADGVDERAEVGLLSHNIVIKGGANAAQTGLGGQMMIMRGGIAHLENLELTHMGRKGQMGQYPLHFHLAGDEAGAYVRNCSLHHNYNRCLTIHGTNNLQVSGNVAYDTVGHCYFLEDGVETGNIIENNLGLLTRRAKPGEAILPSDLTPATFWITNPSNILRGNAASGSQGNGFWYNFPEHPTGLSQSTVTDKTLWPRRLPLGVFENNSTHSNENDGLFVDNGPNSPGVYEAPNYNPPVTAIFEGLTSYKNRRRGVWLRGSKMEIVHAKLADNSIGATFAASLTTLRDSLIVGETANSSPGSPPKPEDPKCPIVGFEFYDGLVGVKNVTFVNFRPNALRPAGALTTLRYTPFFVDPRNSVAGAKFIHANAVFLPTMHDPGPYSLSGDGYRSAVFCDADGSVTGRSGSCVTNAGPFLRDVRSSLRPAWNAAVTESAFGRLFVDNRDRDPKKTSPVTIRREEGAKPTYRMWGSPADGGKPNTSFQTNLLPRGAYRVGFTGPPPTSLRLTLRFLPAGNWVKIAVPTPARPFEAYRDHNHALPLAQAGSEADFVNAHGGKVFRQGGMLWMLLFVSHGDTSVVEIVPR